MAIKAIETAYNGVKFRSRLEARWAIFMDELGIKWAYEYEGFDLHRLGWYLPDFWLPNSAWFVEVKPALLTDLEKARINFLDTHPPEYALGCFPVVGQPEQPTFEYYPDGEFKCWSGNTAFLLIWEGINNMNMVADAISAAKSARFGS